MDSLIMLLLLVDSTVNDNAHSITHSSTTHQERPIGPLSPQMSPILKKSAFPPEVANQQLIMASDDRHHSSRSRHSHYHSDSHRSRSRDSHRSRDYDRHRRVTAVDPVMTVTATATGSEVGPMRSAPFRELQWTKARRASPRCDTKRFKRGAPIQQQADRLRFLHFRP